MSWNKDFSKTIFMLAFLVLSNTHLPRLLKQKFSLQPESSNFVKDKIRPPMHDTKCLIYMQQV